MSDFCQLFRSRLFPATVLQPESVFTFRTLELYGHLAVELKLSAQDFCRALTSMTDSIIPESVPVSSPVENLFTPFLTIR